MKNKNQSMNLSRYRSKNLLSLAVLAAIVLSGCSSLQRGEGYRAPSNDNSAAVPLEDVSTFTAIEKANYFAKNRQFDSAIMQYEFALTNRAWANSNSLDWNLGLRRMISIVIHVKRDPNLALEMVSRVSASGAVPTVYSDEVHSWKEQFKEWRNQRQPNPSTPSAQLSVAKSLIKSPASGLNGLVSFMRASAYLNDYMKTSDPKSADYSEALYMSGNIAQQLGRANLWTHSAEFFNACAQIAGNNLFADRCKEKLSTMTPSG